jgi:hypothetical protein
LPPSTDAHELIPPEFTVPSLPLQDAMVICVAFIVKNRLTVTIMDLWTVTYAFLFYRSDPDSLTTHSDCHEVAYDY